MPTRPLMPSSVHDGMDKIGETKTSRHGHIATNLLPFGLDSTDPPALVPIGQLLRDQINQVGLSRFTTTNKNITVVLTGSKKVQKGGLRRSFPTKSPDGRVGEMKFPLYGWCFLTPPTGEFKSPDGRVQRESGGKPFFFFNVVQSFMALYSWMYSTVV